jgi:hypothetical protein
MEWQELEWLGVCREECPKCGWNPETYIGNWTRHYCPEPDALQITCPGCMYSWLEPTIDKPPHPEPVMAGPAKGNDLPRERWVVWTGAGPGIICAHLYAELSHGAMVSCCLKRGHEGRHAFRWEG